MVPVSKSVQTADWTVVLESGKELVIRILVVVAAETTRVPRWILLQYNLVVLILADKLSGFDFCLSITIHSFAFFIFRVWILDLKIYKSKSSYFDSIRTIRINEPE